jgi:squalene synthase HpnC
VPFSWTAAEPVSPPLVAAYAACAKLARAHHENFPVASLLLPRDMRRHVAAVYAFARAADDFADEGDHSDAERECLLDDWLHRLRASVRTDSCDDPASVFAAIGNTIRVCRLPLPLFEDLIGAFRQDITTKRYATWDDLLGYCRRSANPVGRLVLRIAGKDEAALDAASDALCTALQLTNFWQDLERDWKKGRLYVPLADVDACGAREADLNRGAVTPAWQAALRLAADRTRALFTKGRPVCDGVAGRLQFELRLIWLGGVRVLDRLERVGFDVFKTRPSLGIRDVPPLLRQALSWRAAP